MNWWNTCLFQYLEVICPILNSIEELVRRAEGLLHEIHKTWEWPDCSQHYAQWQVSVEVCLQLVMLVLLTPPLTGTFGSEPPSVQCPGGRASSTRPGVSHCLGSWWAGSQVDRGRRRGLWTCPSDSRFAYCEGEVGKSSSNSLCMYVSAFTHDFGPKHLIGFLSEWFKWKL